MNILYIGDDLYTSEDVASWRQRHAWTQEEAASHLRLPVETYRKRETGKRQVIGIMRVAMAGLDLAFPMIQINDCEVSGHFKSSDK